MSTYISCNQKRLQITDPTMSTHLQTVNSLIRNSFVGFALSLSKDVGILQVLLDAEHPITSQEIADRKDLKERYVREILDALAVAEIIRASTNDTGCLVYHIEENDKETFKTPAMACISFISVFSTIYETVKGCIPKTGPYGIRYTEAVHNMMDELLLCRLDSCIGGFMRSVDGLKEKLECGIEVIEFGCGRGRMVAKLAEMFPDSSFTASEYSPDLVERLKSNFGHIPNMKFEVVDLNSIPRNATKQFDWLYCVNTIHHLPRPLESMKRIRRLVKEPDGVFMMVQFATSASPIVDKGKMDVAYIHAASIFIVLPQQTEDSQAVRTTWDKNSAINLAAQAGFKVSCFDVGYNSVIYVCTP